jgi:hypothetical protein
MNASHTAKILNEAFTSAGILPARRKLTARKGKACGKLQHNELKEMGDNTDDQLA